MDIDTDKDMVRKQRRIQRRIFSYHWRAPKKKKMRKQRESTVMPGIHQINGNDEQRKYECKDTHIDQMQPWKLRAKQMQEIKYVGGHGK